MVLYKVGKKQIKKELSPNMPGLRKPNSFIFHISDRYLYKRFRNALKCFKPDHIELENQIFCYQTSVVRTKSNDCPK